VLRKSHAVEERGRCMATMNEIVKFGLPKPSYAEVGPYLRLTIPLTTEAALETQLLLLNPETTGHLSREEQIGLAYLLGNPRASNMAYGGVVGISVMRTVDRQLAKLEADGLIERSGPPRDRTIIVTAKARR